MAQQHATLTGHYEEKSQKFTEKDLPTDRVFYVSEIILPVGTNFAKLDSQMFSQFPRLETLVARESQNVDRLVSQLSDANLLINLDLRGSDLSDESLAQLHKLTALHSLECRQSKVTEVGVKQFKQAVPGCRVVSDFGNFDYELRTPPSFRMPGDQEKKYALSFDGVDDYVDIQSDWVYDGSELTFEAWVTPEALEELTSGNLLCLDHGEGAARRSVRVCRVQRDALLHVLNIPQTTVPTFKDSLLPGIPVHIAVVWKEPKPRLFIDGIEQDGNSFEWQYAVRERPPFTTLGAFLSSKTDGPKDAWPGQMSQVRLSSKALYDGNFTPEKDLKADDNTISLYKFTEGTGATLKDHSGKNRHGTIHGATWVNADGTPIEESNQPLDDPYAKDRAAAEWVISKGGHVSLTTSSHQFVNKIGTLDELPKEDFTVQMVHLRGANLTQEDLAAIRGLTQLRWLDLIGSQVTEKIIPTLASFPLLGQLEISLPLGLKTSALHRLKHLPRLYSLSISDTQVDDNWEFLEQLPSLRILTLNISYSDVSLPDAEQLGRLRTLHLYSRNTEVAEKWETYLTRDILPKSNRLRVVYEKPGSGVRTFGIDHERTAAKQLADLGVRFGGADLWGGKQITSDAFPKDGVFYLSYIVIPKGVQIPESLDLRVFPDLQSFRAEELIDADRVVTQLAENHGLNSIVLSGSDLTDAGLEQLQKLVRLSGLTIQNTNVTKEGIERFKRAVPGCVVQSDFGTFERELLMPPGFRLPGEARKSSALSFDGISSRVGLPNYNYQTQENPYTIEIWATPLGFPKGGFGQETGFLFGNTDSALRIQPDGHWLFIRRGSDAKAQGGNLPYQLSSQQPASLGERAHLAGVFDGKDLRFFVNGKLQQELRNVQLTEEEAWFLFGAIPAGRTQELTPIRMFEGTIDEARFSSSAKYTSDFEPDQRLVKDPDTIALYHFDEGQGESLIDSSGNNYLGTIHGATWVNADGTPIEERSDYALTFNGLSEYVNVPSLNHDGDHPLTVEGKIVMLPGDEDQHFLIAMHGEGLFVVWRNNEKWSVSGGSDRKGPMNVFESSPDELGRPLSFACTLDGSELRLFVDGKERKQVNRGRYVLPPRSGTGIGHQPQIGGPRRTMGASGRFLELRISRGLKRQADYAPPNTLKKESDTIALYHFDEGAGKVLHDSSDNGHHGEIIGAKWVNSDGTPIKVPDTPEEIFARERAAAEWVIQNGGKVFLTPPILEHDVSKSNHRQQADLKIIPADSIDVFFTKRPLTVANLSQLPDEDFIVGGIFLRSETMSDLDLLRFENLHSLRVLDLELARITDEGLKLISRIKTLKMLYLSHTLITDEGFVLLANLRELESISVARTKVTSTGLTVLTQLPRFHALNLSGPMLDAETFSVMQKISTLNQLMVYELTDEHLGQISRLKNLKRIDILRIKNSYSEEGLRGLKKALPDCQIK